MRCTPVFLAEVQARRIAVGAMGKIVAVMQPYFLPYAGYFRLFAAADEVVLLDTVQFPRRGFVHRNKFRRQDGRLDWLSLPLAAQPVDTAIAALRFSPTARQILQRRVGAFPLFARPDGLAGAVLEHLHGVDQVSPADLIVSLLRECCETMALPFADLRASDLDTARGLRGQARILAIARARDAATYLNPPGGRALYDAEAFAREGVELRFLAPYPGPTDSILQRLHDASARSVREDIMAANVHTR